MRLVTSKIVDAFVGGRNLKVGNTRSFDGAIYLHDNKIAEYRADGLWITNAGWFSNTTKERLNGLPFVRIYQYQHNWYLNANRWDGSWIRVSDIPNPRWFHLNFRVPSSLNTTITLREREIPEPEFDLTCDWSDEAECSIPLYAVLHVHKDYDCKPAEKLLKREGIPSRRMEFDTAGKYLPNYFVVVAPKDKKRAEELLYRD